MDLRKGYTSTVLQLAGVAVILGCVLNAQAQFRAAPVRIVGDKITCHVGGSTYDLTPNKRLIYETSFAANYAEVQEIFESVTGYTKLRSNIYTIPVIEDINVEICPGDVNYIAYNADWLKALDRDANNKWAIYAIIAHEIGHYVLAHDRTAVGSDPAIELQADEYAGEILAKMDACLSDAQAAFNSRIMQRQRGDSHPPIAQRLAAVERGWSKFGKCATRASMSRHDSSQPYLKMDVDGRLNTIYIRAATESSSGTIVSSTSTSNANSNNSGSSTQSVSDSVSGDTRSVIVNGDHVVKTLYLELGKTAVVNLWGQNIKLFISSQISDRVKVNDRGVSNEVIIN
jgi:hypothetical protein